MPMRQENSITGFQVTSGSLPSLQFLIDKHHKVPRAQCLTRVTQLMVDFKSFML